MLILFFLQYMSLYAQIFYKREYSLFPTEGELFSFNLASYGGMSNQIYQMNSDIPFVELKQTQQIYQTKGEQQSSITSNNTHFATLSQQNEVFMYEWKNQMLIQIGQPVPIDPSFKCFNLNLYLDFKILLDCYKNNTLYLLEIVDNLTNIVYQTQSIIPQSSKMQSILNGTNPFIIYAQYFGNFSILSLISGKFQNLSCYSNQFIDFDIPISISPRIYVITLVNIFQFQISSDLMFEQTSNFTADNQIKFYQIQANSDISQYSQCDQISVLQFDSSEDQYDLLKIQYFYGCEYNIMINTMMYIWFFEFTPPYEMLKIFQNNQFLIWQEQSSNQIFIFSINFDFQSSIIIKNNPLLYLNADNELFTFNDDIIVYQISLPKLQINLTNQIVEKYNYNFTARVIGSYNFLIDQQIRRQFVIIKFKLNIQILPPNDTNIYTIHQQQFPSIMFLPDITFHSFSGQLLNYAPHQENYLLNYTQRTFQKIGVIDQQFYLAQLLQGVPNNLKKIYLIGYNNFSLLIYTCQLDLDDYGQYNYSSSLLNQFEISMNAKLLRVAFSIYPEIILIGLSDTYTIYLFKQNQQNNTCDQLNYTSQHQFSDFTVTYQSIIILIQNQEVQIMSLNFTNQFTINQQYINKYYPNFLFNPIQIVVNTQFQSSFLYINNIDSVIVVSIDKNNIPIPITIISANITIKQINLVNYQLILSYVCNNNHNICFQVWNILNLPQFYFVKNLYSFNYEDQIVISSDNMFLYVTFSNYTVYAYEPLLSQHMSLYYMFELTSSILSTQALCINNMFVPSHDGSLILQKNNFYKLTYFQQIQISILYDDLPQNNPVQYPLIIYNYDVTSKLNLTAIQHTPIQSDRLIQNFTIFSPLSYQTIDLTLNNLIIQEKNFTFPMSLILNRQISYCGSIDQNQTYDLSKYCSLSYYNVNSNNITNEQNYSLITSINNQFFALQNNLFISIFHDNLTQITNYNYSNLNFSECLKSTFNNNTLYSICQNDSSQYWLIFQFNNNNSTITLTNLIKFDQIISNISKINCILDQMFILGSLNEQIKQLYWFNQSNNNFYSITQQSGDCLDFSVALFQQDYFNKQQQSIIIFYILKINFQVQFQLMQIYDIIKLTTNNQVIIPNCLTQRCSRNYQDIIPSHPNWVQIILVNYDNVFILLSDNNLNEIVNVRINKNSFKYNESFGEVVTTIPNYGNSSNLGNTMYKNGVLMLQFQLDNNQNQFIVGTYYLNPLEENINQFEPILMYGSFYTTSKEYAMIINEEYQTGTSLYFSNNQIYNYSISTWNVTCHYNYKKKQINVSIYCNNSFSNGIYNITFNLPQVEQSHRRWIYALLSIIVLLLLVFYYKVKQSMRNREYIKSEIEL